jgi:hypothetical protein
MLLRCFKWVSLCSLLLLLQACNTGKTDDLVLDTEVEKEYQLDLWEALVNGTRSLHIRASTLKNQECLNYSIESSISRKNNNIEINLIKLLAPLNCDAGSGPAKATLDLGALPNGTYQVTVKLGKVIPSTGRLLVSTSSFFLSLPSAIGFRLGNNTLLRIPEQTLWGYLSYEAGQQSLVNQFLNEFNAISQDAELAKGYYGYFNLAENGNIEYGNQISSDRPLQPLLRRFQGNEAELERLIKTYRDKHKLVLSIHLRNTAGKEY